MDGYEKFYKHDKSYECIATRYGHNQIVFAEKGYKERKGRNRNV